MLLSYSGVQVIAASMKVIGYGLYSLSIEQITYCSFLYYAINGKNSILSGESIHSSFHYSRNKSRMFLLNLNVNSPEYHRQRGITEY